MSEEVPVIFIAHKNTIEGKKRTRKLFSTLNRRAKPVGDNYQIALDEDDIVAIVTREIVEEFDLFQGERLLNGTTKQIPNSNVTAFTSLIALYQCNEEVIYSTCRNVNNTVCDIRNTLFSFGNGYVVIIVQKESKSLNRGTIINIIHNTGRKRCMTSGASYAITIFICDEVSYINRDRNINKLLGNFSSSWISIGI